MYIEYELERTRIQGHTWGWNEQRRGQELTSNWSGQAISEGKVELTSVNARLKVSSSSRRASACFNFISFSMILVLLQVFSSKCGHLVCILYYVGLRIRKISAPYSFRYFHDHISFHVIYCRDEPRGPFSWTQPGPNRYHVIGSVFGSKYLTNLGFSIRYRDFPEKIRNRTGIIRDNAF